MNWISRCSTFAALIVSMTGAAQGREAHEVEEASIPHDTALLEISAPPRTEITFDGRREPIAQVLKVSSLKRGQLIPRVLTARFASGEALTKTLLLRGGLRYRVPLADPKGVTPELVVQAGHFGPIWSVAFSPDGKQVLTGSGDHTAILWDAAAGTMLKSYTGHTNDIDSVAFSPDGKRIATTSYDGFTFLIDKKSGKILLRLAGQKCVAFSPDGNRIITGSSESTATIWDAVTGQPIRQLEGDPIARRKRLTAAAKEHPRQQAEVTAVAFSSDGKRSLTGEAEAKVILWDVESGSQVRMFQGHQEMISSVAFSPDGKSILSGSWDNTSILWDAETGAKIRVCKEHARGLGFLMPNHFNVTSVAFSPDGKSILTGSWDKTAVLSETTTGAQQQTLKGHDDHVTSVAFSPDGKRVLTGSREGKAILWDAANGQKTVVFDGCSFAGVASIAVSPDSQFILTGYKDGKAIAWNINGHLNMTTFKTNQRDLASVAYSPDGQTMLTGSLDGAILWHCKTKEKLRKFAGNIQSAAFLPDAKSVLTWQYVQTKKRYSPAPILWDAKTGAKLRRLDWGDCNESCIAFSPDSRHILIGSYQGAANLFETMTGRLLASVKGENHSGITAACFSPDGKLALSAFEDATLGLWKVGTKESVRKFSGHKQAVKSIAFSADGKQILTGSADQTLILWDAVTGDKLRIFSSVSAGVIRSVTFASNDRLILSGSEDGAIRLWDLATGDELCRLFALGADDWLAVTPDGLFDGSPRGINKVTYRKSKDQPAAVELDLNKKLHLPDLLPRIWKGERPTASEVR